MQVVARRDGAAARGLKPRLSPVLFAAFVAASIGGPLALGGLYLPGTADDVLSSAGFVTVAAVVVFAAPIAVWCGYSERIVSAGGLTAFVEAAAGRRVARVQAAIWAIAYALYLPYTVSSSSTTCCRSWRRGSGRTAPCSSSRCRSRSRCWCSRRWSGSWVCSR